MRATLPDLFWLSTAWESSSCGEGARVGSEAAADAAAEAAAEEAAEAAEEEAVAGGGGRVLGERERAARAEAALMLLTELLRPGVWHGASVWRGGDGVAAYPSPYPYPYPYP